MEVEMHFGEKRLYRRLTSRNGVNGKTEDLSSPIVNFHKPDKDNDYAPAKRHAFFRVMGNAFSSIPILNVYSDVYVGNHDEKKKLWCLVCD